MLTRRDVASPDPVTRVSPTAAFAVAALGIALFSCMDALIKGLALESGAYRAMLWRSAAGAAVIAPVMFTRALAWPDRARLWLHVKRSAAAALSVLIFFWGLVRVPMAEGVALAFLSPVIAILLAAVMLGERVRARAMGACLLACVGVGVILWGRARASAGPEAMHGAIACAAASIFYAYNLVLLRRSAQAMRPIEITVFTNILFLIFYLPAAPWLGAWPAARQLPAIFGAAGLALISSMLLAWAYARAQAQQVTPSEYTAFVWSALLGALVFGERLLPATIAGAVLIVAGCVVAARDVRGPEIEAAA